MITLHEWNETNFDNLGIAVLHEAQEIYINQEINGDYRLVFEYPLTSEKYKEIRTSRIVQCEGQIFRINRTEEQQETLTAKVNAMHIVSDTEDHHSHIQYIKNYMGCTPYEIMTGEEISGELKEMGFHLLSPEEVKTLGMEWIDGKIDFWEQSKTNLYRVMMTIIENAGWGELYADGRNIAIVKRIGKDSGLRLDVKLNMLNPEKCTDITELVTRLYPYGQNDLHIGSANNGVQYIDSPNIAKYGIRKGYLDYSDIDSAADLLERAKWEFDERNEERIDIPALSVDARAIDLSVLKEYKHLPNIRTGDTVYLYSKELNMNGIKQRITSMVWYPYEPEKSTVKIGRVKKDLFFYVMKNHSLTHKYKKASNKNGDVKTNWLAGDINTDKNIVRDDDKIFTIDGSLLEIKDPITKDVRVQLGCVTNEHTNQKQFVFIMYKADGETEAIFMDENGNVIFSGTLDTREDCKVGKYLYVGQGMDDGCIYLSTTSDSKGASIYNNSYGQTIISGNKGGDIVFGDRGICIGEDNINNVIATYGDIGDLKKWIEENFEAKNA